MRKRIYIETTILLPHSSHRSKSVARMHWIRRWVGVVAGEYELLTSGAVVGELRAAVAESDKRPGAPCSTVCNC